MHIFSCNKNAIREFDICIERLLEYVSYGKNKLPHFSREIVLMQTHFL